MFCPKCGNQINAGEAFCPSCGARNEAAAPVAPQAPAAKAKKIDLPFLSFLDIKVAEKFTVKNIVIAAIAVFSLIFWFVGTLSVSALGMSESGSIHDCLEEPGLFGADVTFLSVITIILLIAGVAAAALNLMGITEGILGKNSKFVGLGQLIIAGWTHLFFVLGTISFVSEANDLMGGADAFGISISVGLSFIGWLFLIFQLVYLAIFVIDFINDRAK